MSIDDGRPRGWVPVCNAAGCWSVWPCSRPTPDGWRVGGAALDRSAALDAAARAWEDADAAPRSAPPARPGATIDQRVRAAGQRSPSAIALTHGHEHLTYAQLIERADRLQVGLARAGVESGDTVGVCMDRGSDMVALLLAILGAGAAYVPLDGRYPVVRLASMADDAALRCIVTGPNYAEKLAEVVQPVIEVSSLRTDEGSVRRRSEPDGLAYVMYTSGSTGKPKGVEVSHRNVGDFIDAMTELLGVGAAARVLFSTRLSFDIAGLEIFYPLMHGGTCVIAPDTWIMNANTLVSLVNVVRPSIVQATPAGWRLLLDAGVSFDDEQLVLCGGDRLGPSLSRELVDLPAAAWNLYGPTEATIWATGWQIEPGDVSIGSSLAHATTAVLDDQMQPVDPGEEGELYIGGPAVAQGYRGQRRLTAERFVPDPFSAVPGARLYATGDIVRVVDGGLRYLRRRDTQVKVNGHRIELGEIEAVAAEVAGVRSAVALIAEEEETRSIRLVIEAPGDADAIVPAVVEHLREVLPAPMVPKEVRVVDAMPLTDNGKVDAAALLALATTPVARATRRS